MSLKKMTHKMGLLVISAFLLFTGFSMPVLAEKETDENGRVKETTEYMIEGTTAAEAYASAEAEGKNHDRYFIGEILDDNDNLIGYRLITIDYPVPDGLGVDVPLTIIQQPESQVYNWSDPVTFEVVVDRPDDVAEYHWCLFDGVGVKEFDGETASQSKLILPSTFYMDGTHYYYCEIKDVNGHWYTSDDATLRCADTAVEKRVFYIGEYAVRPGETFDLADYDIGSGKVIYDASGTDVTLDNIQYTNDKVLYDSHEKNGQGFFWCLRRRLDNEYHVNVVGDCSFDNNFYDEVYSSMGVMGNIFFAIHFDDDWWPKIIFEGDGSITMNGAEYGIYCDGDVEIEIDYNFSPKENKGIQNGLVAPFSFSSVTDRIGKYCRKLYDVFLGQRFLALAVFRQTQHSAGKQRS